VARIFINLERRSPPTSFHGYGSRLVPAFNYLQTASCLYEENVLDAAAMRQVVESLQRQSSYSPGRIVNSLADVERRGHVRSETARELRDLLAGEEYLPAGTRLRPRRPWRRWWRAWQTWKERIRARRRAPLTGDPFRVDYGAILRLGQDAESDRS
jgi:hypothetical protein